MTDHLTDHLTTRPTRHPILRLALSGVRANRARFATLAFAIFIGVLFIAATLTITDTVQSGYDSLFGDAYKDVAVSVREKSSVTRQDQTFRGRIDGSVLETIVTIPGVKAVVPRIFGYAYVVSAQGITPENVTSDTTGAPIAENWNTDEKMNLFSLVSGKWPFNSGDVVIDRRTAKSAKIRVGDAVTLVSKNGSTPARAVGVVRFGSVDSPGAVPVVLLTTADAEQILGEPGKVDALSVRSDSSLSDTALAELIQHALPTGVEAVTGRAVTKERQTSVESSLRFFTAFLLIFAVLSLIVGAFIIANTFAMSISQRTRDLALLRAIGGSRNQIRRLVLGEAFVMSIAGSVLGLIGGIALASGLRTLLRVTGVDLPPSPLVVHASTVAWSLGIGVVVTLISALMPSIHAARIAPVAAMRDSELEPKPVFKRTLLGLALTPTGAFVMKHGADAPNLARTGQGIAVLFLGVLLLAPALSSLVRVLVAPSRRVFGTTTGLAMRNATRNPRRTASTALALSLGSAVACFAVILNASLQSSLTNAVAGGLRGDLVIRSGSFGVGGLPVSLVKEVAALPSVLATSGLRYGFATVDGPKRKPRHASAVSRTGGRPIASIDPTTADRLLDFGLEKGSFADLGRGTIALSERELDDHGWNVGDTIKLGFPGKPNAPFRITTVFRQGIAFDFAIGNVDYEKYVADLFDFVVYIAARPGVSIDALRMQVTDLVAKYPAAKVENPKQYVARITNSLDQLLSLIVGLLVVVVVVAVLGIAITLSLSVVERVREIGLLRTLGMHRRQVRSMLRSEAIVISLFAVTIGVALGTSGAWSLLRALRGEGLTEFVLPRRSVLLLALLAAIAGLVASILPARRAARLPLLAALSGVQSAIRSKPPRFVSRRSLCLAVAASLVSGSAIGFGVARSTSSSSPVDDIEISTGTASKNQSSTSSASLPTVSSPATTISTAELALNAPYTIPTLSHPLHAGELLSADVIAAAPQGVRGWRVLFGSQQSNNAAVAVSGLVYVPDRPAPAGGWPVLSFAHPTTGLADRCAPSKNPGILETTVAALANQLNMAVVGSDYPGLGTPGPHPFLDGVSAGRSVLDVAMAAASIPKVSLSKSLVLWGHSQGGHAALFAAEQAPTYAPQLNLRGVVAGAPPSQLVSLVERLATTPDRGYALLVAKGLAATNPALVVSDVLTPRAITLAERLDSECSGDVLTTARQETLLKPGALPDAWTNALQSNEPGHATINAPVLIIQGGADELVLPDTSATLATQLMSLGVKVERKVYPGEGHGSVVFASLTDVVNWISAKVTLR